MVKAIKAISEAFDVFTLLWNNLPVILEASWQTMIDWFGGVVDLAMSTGKSVFNILKEAFDFSKIATGDFSGLRNATRDAVIQLQEDLGSNLSLKATFEKNLMELLKPDGGSEDTALNASAANAINGATANAELTDVSSEVTGTKATNINLNIEKLIENLNFNTSSLSETTGKIKEEVTKVLIEALRDTTAIATN